MSQIMQLAGYELLPNGPELIRKEQEREIEKDVSPVTSVFDRFDAKWTPEPFSGCWLWTAGIVGKGYGHFDSGRAHRFSWERRYGAIPNGLMVCHKCDTPSCVNPEHLFLGTALDNVRDCIQKGREAKGEKQGAAKLTESDVILILELANTTGNKALARRFGVSPSAIRFIIQRKTWKHVQEAEPSAEKEALAESEPTGQKEQI